jgi:hypothetical protein
MMRAAVMVLFVLVGMLVGIGVGAAVGHRMAVKAVREEKRNRPARSGEEWDYPKARIKQQDLCGGTFDIGSQVLKRIVTDDGVDEVVGYFAGKMGMPASAFVGQKATWEYVDEAEGRSMVFYRPDGAGEGDREVVVKVMGKRSPGYDVIVTVSRGAGEKQTHVVIDFRGH